MIIISLLLLVLSPPYSIKETEEIILEPYIVGIVFIEIPQEEVFTELQEEEEELETLEMEFTFYTSDCKGCIGITKWGYDVRDTITYDGMRIIATDPEVIPPHSIVQFELEGEILTAIAGDTGGDIKGNRIDLLVETHEEAIELGRQIIPVTILRKGND